MDGKKILMVYYSRKGTTRKLADHLADQLKCEVEEIIDTTNRAGLIGWIISGRDSVLKKLTVIKPMTKKPQDYDLVIIGTPIWAGGMTPAVRTYITQNKESFKEIAFFCTEGGSGGPKVFADIEQLCGVKPVSTLELLQKEVETEDFEIEVRSFIGELTKQ